MSNDQLKCGFDDEDEVVDHFIDCLSLYPFKTKLMKEHPASGGRVDVYMPHYDVVIEAKGPGGNLKHAIGQSVYYAESLSSKPYVLAPAKEVDKNHLDVYKSYDIGLIVVNPRSLKPKVVNDIGGMDQFNLEKYDRVKSEFQYVGGESDEYIVGSEELKRI